MAVLGCCNEIYIYKCFCYFFVFFIIDPRHCRHVYSGLPKLEFSRVDSS